jgi:hypothetical protein
VDPSTFSEEQWRAVNAFADAQARANFAYQQQLPAQQIAQRVDNFASGVVTLFLVVVGLVVGFVLPVIAFGDSTPPLLAVATALGGAWVAGRLAMLIC